MKLEVPSVQSVAGKETVAYWTSNPNLNRKVIGEACEDGRQEVGDLWIGLLGSLASDET